MKTLYIVRHAKSSWDDLTLPDHDRPLLQKGIKRTLKVARYLRDRISTPDLILSSTAIRAKDTASIVAEQIGYPVGKIQYNRNLYHANPEDINAAMYGLSNEIESVMIFGHNPGLTYFVNQFLEPPIENLPTSGIVNVVFKTDEWENIDTCGFHVNFVATPKNI